MAMTTRSKNLLILALMVLPFILTFAYVRLFVDLDDMERNNKGNLIIPHVDFSDLKPRLPDGSVFDASALDGKWTMLYLSNGECGTACKNGLYYLVMQLRKSLDTDTPRVRRIIATTRTPTPELREFLDDKVAGMEELLVDSVALEHALLPFMKGAGSAVDHIFLVSPDGKIFIWYPTHEDMQDVLLEADRIRADLKRTLKGSLVG